MPIIEVHLLTFFFKLLPKQIYSNSNFCFLKKILQDNPSSSLKTETSTDVIDVTAKSERIVNHKPVNWIDYLGVEYYRRFFSVPIEGKFIQNLSGLFKIG